MVDATNKGNKMLVASMKMMHLTDLEIEYWSLYYLKVRNVEINTIKKWLVDAILKLTYMMRNMMYVAKGNFSKNPILLFTK